MTKFEGDMGRENLEAEERNEAELLEFQKEPKMTFGQTRMLA